MSAWQKVVIALFLVVTVIVVVFTWRTTRPERAIVFGPPYRLAVLGDSDSHIYRDHVQGVRRGGEHHALTFQWTEILAATRADFFDMGELGVHGSRGILARMRARLGFEAKTPRKYDFRWNYARSGARCASLTSDWPQQTRWLESALRADPAGWGDGIVLIKIGVNDLGQRRHLDAYASTGLTSEVRAIIEACVHEISTTIDRIRAASPNVRIIVVGVADDSSWPASEAPHRDPADVVRIREVLDQYDRSLQTTIARRGGVAFMSDRNWYYDHWADRDAQGNARVSGVSLGGRTPVTNTKGDAPNHLLLEDGHAGTVANGFWAAQLILTLRRAFDLDIPPLTHAEIARVADPDGELGLAP